MEKLEVNCVIGIAVNQWEFSVWTPIVAKTLKDIDTGRYIQIPVKNHKGNVEEVREKIIEQVNYIFDSYVKFFGKQVKRS